MHGVISLPGATSFDKENLNFTKKNIENLIFYEEFREIFELIVRISSKQYLLL